MECIFYSHRLQISLSCAGLEGVRLRGIHKMRDAVVASSSAFVNCFLIEISPVPYKQLDGVSEIYTGLEGMVWRG
ncbi:hypothetical protein H5410_048087 [Solanum commersonii]|uniref:Uncharacterized protein n=1 Tax=Solanum commersonii TaxID=4109 RepID=A0A9J5XIS6_SOLCO|nr:hypothetical protein H5410_048087 [Solanum commersonii]